MISAGLSATTAAATKRPQELLAVFARGPASSLDGMRAFASASSPGAGLAVTDGLVSAQLARLVGMSSLDGFDRASPSYLLVVDTQPRLTLMILGKVNDDAAVVAALGSDEIIRRKGWALVGPKAAIETVAAYALSTLVDEPAQTGPTIVLYVPQLLARYQTEIASFATQMTDKTAASDPQIANLVKAVFAAEMTIAADTEQAIVTLDATQDLATLDIALIPKRGTKLAAFVAAQVATDYALLDRLPDTGAVLVGGHLVAGPYREPLLEALVRYYGPTIPKQLIAAVGDVMKAATGDLAMSFQPGPTGMTLSELFGIANQPAATRLLDRIFQLIAAPQTYDMMGIAATLVATPGTTEHAGVVMRSYETKYDVSKVSETRRAALAKFSPTGIERTQIGTFDHVWLISVSPDSEAAAREIDAVRGTSKSVARPASVRDLLADSRAHNDSICAVIDLKQLKASTRATPAAPAPMMVSFGFGDRAAHLRITLPSAAVRSLLP